MAILLQAKDRLLSRLKSLTKIQRFNHTLEPQMCREMCSDSFNQEVDVSNWKTVDSRNLGITRAMIPQPSWVVLKILKSQGFQAYLVGGCVRDLLLRRVPKDFDVITTANLKQIRRQFHRSEIIGRRFPICRVHIKGSVIEVSSFETVAKHGEGKETVLLSQIPYGCDEIDLVRWRNSIHRDFTINSLFFDPFLNKIYDYANGISDLRCLKLRTLIPAYLSFTEDCARILRGLRIAARLGLSFCKDIDTAMHSLSSSIERLDKSRIMMELNYMLSYGAAESSICLLRRYNLLKILLPFHAAYLDQQAGKITAENPMMLMRLFFNLDKLVSCDRPADYTLWVGLLSFHQALVSDPQDAFVVWVFASVLYHGKWKEGVKFARDHAKEPVKFVPEISGFSEIESDEQLAVKVTELALSVQDCVNDLTKVFVSKKIERNVQQIFDVLVNSIESYNSGKRSHIIDYDMLGKGNLVETRFVLGKIILKTISGGLVAGEEEIDEEEMPEVLDKDSVENYLAKKNRKRGLQPSSAELKLKTAKKCKWTEKFSSINHELSMNKEDVVPKEEVEEIHKAVKNCQLPDEELKVRTTEKNKWIENSCHFDQELSINEELVPKEGSQQLGEETQKAAKTCQSPEEEIKVNPEKILEKKDCHSLSTEGTNKKRDKQKRADDKKKNGLLLSSLFKEK
ncbi:polynucleotide adenylyltransferase family protein [Citrus sinensis]|nr:polynucleotide adenylyltransferase family protein [Citrus sinensis]